MSSLPSLRPELFTEVPAEACKAQLMAQNTQAWKFRSLSNPAFNVNAVSMYCVDWKMDPDIGVPK